MKSLLTKTRLRRVLLGAALIAMPLAAFAAAAGTGLCPFCG